MKDGVAVADDEQLDGCEFHEAGLHLVAALLAKLDELEQRIAALEKRERASVDVLSG